MALEGITIGRKTLREHFEAINHRDAILFVEDLATQQQTLEEYTIKSLHQLGLKNIDDDNAGLYREVNYLLQVPTINHLKQCKCTSKWRRL